MATYPKLSWHVLSPLLQAGADGERVVAILYGSLVLFLVAAVIVRLVAAILPARRAARLNVLRALQYE